MGSREWLSKMTIVYVFRAAGLREDMMTRALCGHEQQETNLERVPCDERGRSV